MNVGEVLYFDPHLSYSQQLISSIEINIINAPNRSFRVILIKNSKDLSLIWWMSDTLALENRESIKWSKELFPHDI